MSFQVLGRVVVILGSTKATKDLLEKRAGVYSDRPVIPFFEMYALSCDRFILLLILHRMDVQWSLLLSRYGGSWRLRRKIAERAFCPGSLDGYRTVQETRARVLTTRLLRYPQEWTAHIELSGVSPFLYAASLTVILVFRANNS